MQVCRDSLAVHKRRWEQITPFVQLGGIFSCQSIVMVSSSSKKGRIVAAINSLGDDGVIVSPLDYNKFEALIGDYFDDSDESGCEDDSECGKI